MKSLPKYSNKVFVLTFHLLELKFEVESTVRTVFGETSMHGREEATDKVVYISGNVSFGELKIIHI